MKVFAISDIHVDHQSNKEWLLGISSQDYKSDILILAGDLTDNLQLLEYCLRNLASKFAKVLFVPGNHELWVARNKDLTSFQKFYEVLKISADCGVLTSTCHIDHLSIVPLFSWYDFSFGQPCEKLRSVWSDFKTCTWTTGYTEREVTDYFLRKNTDTLNTHNNVLISFSHFLPRIDLMPFYIPPSYRYLYPVLGSSLLGEQIKILKPKIHVYGHSHVNQTTRIEGTNYINNAFGYPSETNIARKKLLCVYEHDE